MKLVINSQQVEGKLEDLVLLLQNSKPKTTKIPIKTGDATGLPEATPLQQTLNESAELRKKIAENPDYNPYGGVVPSNEPTIPEQQLNRSYSAEEETGIKYD